MQPGSFLKRHGRGILAYLLGVVFIALVVAAAHGLPLVPQTFHRWDSGHYLSLAERGPILEKCSGASAVLACGNAGWMFTYPALVRIVSWTGVPLPWAGWMISLIASLFLALRLSTILSQIAGIPERRRWILMALAVVFPGISYRWSIFPLSLFSLGILETWNAVHREQYRRAILWGFFSGSVYSSGIFITLPMLLFLGISRWSQNRSLIDRGSIESLWFPAGSAVAGLSGVCVYYGYVTGNFLAFFHVQGRYGHGVNAPWSSWWNFLKRGDATSAQSLLCFAMLLMSGVSLYLRRSTAPAILRGLWLQSCLLWVQVLMVGANVSLYRNEAALLPLVACLVFVPDFLLVGLVLLCGWNSVVMWGHFLGGRLL